MTPAAKPREHITHFDDCGCLSARHAQQIADANATILRLQRRLDRATSALESCEDYFYNRADADAVGDPPQFVGNTEMTLLGAVRRALGKE